MGDNFEHDYLGCTNAGMRGVWLNRYDKPPREGVPTITSLNEFGTIFD